MKKKNFLAPILALALMVGFTACDDGDGDGGNGGGGGGSMEMVPGSIQGTYTLTADKVWNITGPVIVEENATLNIEKGTTIKANVGFNCYILVLQDGKINVNGTAAEPVIMTLNKDGNIGALDRWGGLVINGRAPLTAGQTGSTEISTFYHYGGNLPHDDSGVIKFLKLEYTGFKTFGDIEHNGLTLNGVGDGTEIHDIFVINGKDDGIEFFGGTVDVSNVLVVNSEDDMFDFTYGYSGTLTNAYGIWDANFSTDESDPSGVEADGNLDGNSPASVAGNTPQTNFTITNVTFDLKLPYSGAAMQNLIRIRRDCKGTINNALVQGTGHVQNLFRLGDIAGDKTSYVRITDNLTTDADNMFTPAKDSGDTQASYPQMQIVPGITGCPTNIFTWTGYQF